MLLLNESEFAEYSLQFMNSKRMPSKNVFCRRFRALFGVDCSVAFKVWYLLQTTNVLQIKKYDPTHLLMSLYFLKSYSTEAQISSHFSVDEKTYRKLLWVYIGGLSKISLLYVSSNYVCYVINFYHLKF